MKNFVILILMFSSVSTSAQITSTFDTDADGWIFLNSATPVTINHSSSGGNPGGFISATYAAGATTTTQTWFAPAKFLGSQVLRSLGMNLNFDLQQSAAGTSSINNGDVIIEGGGITLVYSLPVKPAVAPSWSSYSLTLDETQGWRISTISGTLATRNEIIQALSNITNLKIRGTYTSGAGYTSGLDNVVLEQRVLTPAPQITAFSPASAAPGSTVTISGTNFGATAAENIVLFGGIAAAITSATTTEITVTVPDGAQYSPITVINTSAGLSGISSSPFNPLFSGGGRIIPASFAPRSNLPLDLSIEGVALADIDGDGWNDLAVTNNEVDAIDIYRHKGETADITAASFDNVIRITTTGSSTNGAGLKIVDIDGDGMRDLVTSTGEQFSNAYFILFRNISTPGNIAFDGQINVRGNRDESPPHFVGDIDGDGRPELIGGEGSSSAGADLWIAQNISTPGNIEFGASVSYFSATVDAVSGVNLGDMDGDGIPEIIVSTGFGDGFSILKNNSVPGTIALTDLGRISTGQYNRSLTIADMNQDGMNDIIWRRTSGTDVSIRINTNTGAALSLADFTTEVILNSDLGNNGGLAIGDINGDGKTDIVVTDDGDFGVFENIYSGGEFTPDVFVPAYQIQGNGSSTYPTAPIIADLNGDDKPEVILGITNTTPNQISIYMNRNVHAPAISLNTVAPLAGTVGSSVIITGSNFSSVPSENIVYFGAVRANVTAATPTQLTVTVPAGANYAPVSVTKDGLTSRYHLPFNVTFSSGVTFNDTHFAPPAQFTLAGANYDIEVMDLDIDGKPDIVAEGGSLISSIFGNTHSSGSITNASLALATTTSNSAANSKVFDADGDGLADIASPNGRIYKNISSAGNITFSTETSLGLGDSNIDFNDLNDDGKDDIVVAGGGLSQIRVLENRSTPGAFVTAGEFGTFSTTFNFTKPSTGGGIFSEDIDNDGFADVVVSNPGADNISIFRNTGKLKIATTQLDTRIDIAVGDNPSRIYKGDFDIDGKMDLLLYYGTGTNPQLLTLFHNQSTPGNISFVRVDIATTIGNITAAHMNDLDGDGKPDILATSETGNNFSIFKNIHTSGAIDANSFAAPFQTTVAAPRGIATGDLNLDGKPEIILTRAAGMLEVYENLVPVSAIIIDQQPAATTTECAGANMVLDVIASGAANLTYQWQILNTNTSLFEDVANGSTYSGATSASLTINTTTVSGTSTFRVVISGNNVADAISDDAVTEVLAVPDQPIITLIGSSEFCSGLTATLEGPPNMASYSWSTGESSESIIVSSSGTYSLTVTATNSCTSIPSDDIVITVNNPPAQPMITYTGNPEICAGSSKTLTAPDGFTYLWSTGETTREITVAAAGSYSVQLTDGNGCTSIPSNDLVVTVNDPPAQPVITYSGNPEICAGSSKTLTAPDGFSYLWSTGETTREITVASEGSYSVQVTDGNGCTSIPSEDFIITVNDPPAQPVITYSGNPEICNGSSKTLTAPDGFTYLWSTGETTREITVAAAGSYSVQITNGNGCTSIPSAEVVLTLVDCSNNEAPVFTQVPLSTVIEGIIELDLLQVISDPDNNIDVSSFKIISFPGSGAQATIDGQLLRIVYDGISFTGTESITLEACDLLSRCSQQVLEIEVIGDVVVYNAISPNNDGLNDYMIIEYIDIIPDTRQNSLIIYNRWGDKVFETSNYNNTDNVFRGRNAKDELLPAGTYYYKLQFSSSRPTKTGFIAIR